MATGKRFIEKGETALRYVIVDGKKLKKEEIEQFEEEKSISEENEPIEKEE